MEWSKLLSGSRLCRSNEKKSDVRSEFQRDYDRIVYSSAFRRLQDKTQVFPLAESDYVRTRLTHSIEVSCVGRSLGTLAGNFVIKQENLLKDIQPQEFGNIVAAAGFEVLGGLLEKIVPALVNEKQTSAENKVFQLIPPQFTKGKNKYEKLLSATDFVSGMTDSYESPRILRRLQILREWSHEQNKQIFPRSKRTRSPSGARASQ